MRDRELEQHFIFLIVLAFCIIRSLALILVDSINDSFRAVREFNKACDRLKC